MRRDDVYHPFTFRKFVVTSEDASGNPLVTIFYDDMGNELFKWIQEWNGYGKCTLWEVIDLKNV